MVEEDGDDTAAVDEDGGAYAPDFDVVPGPIGYGCWRFAGAELDVAVDRIEAALDAGMTLIDTADIYGYDTPGFGAAEELLGDVLREVPGLRERMVLATKGGIFPPLPYDSSAEYLVQACEASLNRLKVERIDLYQIHRPDLLAHPHEVADALMGLREAGKIREIGVSNHTPAQTRALQAYLDAPIVTTQPEFSPLHLDPLTDGTLDLAMEWGMVPLAWSPLAQGRLMGQPSGRRALAVSAVCARIAQEQGVTRSAVVLAWTMHHPSGVVPIIGTTQVDRIKECARATEVGLSRQQWYEILVAARGEPMP